MFHLKVKCVFAKPNLILKYALNCALEIIFKSFILWTWVEICKCEYFLFPVLSSSGLKVQFFNNENTVIMENSIAHYFLETGRF